MDPFIGEIIMFAGNFAPRGWAFCSGQLLPISSNSALFSILGTTYGGDGRTTFALPDLRGRVPVHPGSGPGLSTYRLGEKAGAENVTLTTAQIPSHHHDISPGNVEVGNEAKGTVSSNTAAGNYVGNHTDAFRTTGGGGNLASSLNGNTANTGGGGSHNNIQPLLCVNFIIALDGIYPSRS